MTAATATAVMRTPGQWPWLLLSAGQTAYAPDTGGQAEDLANLRECRDGNGDRFSRIIARHQDRVAAMMWRFTRNPQAHEELTQEVFVQAWQSLGTYRERAPFVNWLARIATRTGYRYWQQQKRERSRVPLELKGLEDKLADEGVAPEPTEAAELLYSLLSQLPPRDRLVLTLRYLEDLSVAETARRTGWSSALVKVQTLRARSKLEKLMQNAWGMQR